MIRRVSRSTATANVLPSRFAWLMGLHAENYHRLARLFAPARLAPGEYRSSLDDGLDLRLEVVQHHRYTTDLRLTYCGTDPATGESAPSAELRMYHDAKLAEVLHCDAGTRLVRVLGNTAPARNVCRHRVRMGTFLNRWLEYLAEQGHSIGTLERAGAGQSAAAGDSDPSGPLRCAVAVR